MLFDSYKTCDNKKGHQKDFSLFSSTRNLYESDKAKVFIPSSALEKLQFAIEKKNYWNTWKATESFRCVLSETSRPFSGTKRGCFVQKFQRNFFIVSQIHAGGKESFFIEEGAPLFFFSTKINFVLGNRKMPVSKHNEIRGEPWIVQKHFWCPTK